MRDDIFKFVLVSALLCVACWALGIATALAIQDTIRHNIEAQIIAERPSIEIQP